ncbi:unnamed protein product, partial [Didymodactylos carnosus]
AYDIVGDLEQEFICSICTDPFIDPVSHSCLNTFCRGCVKQVTTCPLCRGSIDTLQSAPKALQNMLDRLKINCVACGEETIRGEFINHQKICLETNGGSLKEEPEAKDTGDVTSIELDPTIDRQAFVSILEFLYSGLPVLQSNNLEEVLRVAHLFDCQELVTIVKNIQNGEEDLNPSIGTWLNDTTGERMKKNFLNKSKYCDVAFKLDNNSIVYGHRAVLATRCHVMNRMLNGSYNEKTILEPIHITDTSAKCFLALLEYLYSDHAPIENSDGIGILKLAHRFGVSRLVTLCELYVSKSVEVSIERGILKSAMNVIGLLLDAQKHNANQLADFCLHFISQNYEPMSKRSEWNLLTGRNLEFIEKHRWPPLSYLQQIGEYEKMVAGTEHSDKCRI